MLRRRREKKTDYRQRLSMLKSGKTVFVVRRSANNIHIQLIQYHKKGDKTVLEDSSKSLKKYGWRGHCGNLSAAYLTGMLIGFKALKKNIAEAILNSGLQMSVKGNAIYAAVAGAKDAGMEIPASKDILPSRERISGRHIAEYAAKLKKSSSEQYKKQFSECLKNGLEPEKIEEHFEVVKKKIISENHTDANGVIQSGGIIKEQKTVKEQNEDDEEEWEDVSESEEASEVGEEE